MNGLNPYEHLRDNDGASIGSIRRAARTLNRIQNLLSENNSRTPVALTSRNQNYEDIYGRILGEYQSRFLEFQKILSEYITQGGIRIEDGGLKSQGGVQRKIKLFPNTPIEKFQDISRFRIITKDLHTLMEISKEIDSSLEKDESIHFFIRRQSSRYQERSIGSIYPSVFLLLSNRESSPYFHLDPSAGVDGEEALKRADESALDDFSTEVQILTERVREVSESNRAEYALKQGNKTRNIEFSEYNKSMLRAIVLDWKEYFSQNK